ncbi:dhhc-type zinc finger domain-containing protein [Vairimorpha ceranae]|uniref:Palmitoyltransferase n=1 Tax=Vairimorpha ceranae TaxID=40302 RepID=A0A0F9WCF6_9MICR|nr:dhhc-type zinc finger domain-containing protein [Vairimorpha ceranae]KAF5139592.1 hypothetical protein G9O61_00g022490 [Vairimorpha ceranae]KKO74520.1 dhhc-type zinc finger domain-containing protein [Vairimorpha ceranae]
MELYALVNKCTRKLEYLVISCVVCFYILSIYDTITSSHKILPLYFCLLSFYYYIRLLTKHPDIYLDFNCVDNVCKRCNRLTGRKSVHCEICNKCFYKRDHHCVITGKCISADNTPDLYFTVLFMFLYSILALFRSSCLKEFIFFYKYMCFLSGFLLVWLTLLCLSDKTTGELIKNFYIADFKIKNMKNLNKNGILCVVLPIVCKTVRII